MFNQKTGLYELDNVLLVNTREFSRTAQYYKKNGVFTKAHPKYDKIEYDAFWDEEERRRREGYSVGGVHITGKHYGFLNFAQILRTSDPEDTKGVVKDYKHARKTGVKNLDFPDFWDGHYHWFHAKAAARLLGFHIIGGKSRRKGFSYVAGWDSADNYDLYPNLTTVIGAFDNKYLIKGNGTMSMVKKYLNFLNLHTDWYKGRIVNLKDHIKSGYRIRGRDEDYGFLSEVLAISFKDNPDAVAGKDIYEIDLEELGIFPNIDDVLDITLPALEDGDILTGQCVAWGTGGSKDANWETFEEIFYNPMKHRFMAFDNIWDDNARGTTCGFFYPYVQNLTPYMDENGVSDLVKANEVSELRRESKRTNTTDIASFNLWVGQRANKPSEAFSRSTTNIYASQELKDQIHRCKFDPNIKYLARKGVLARTTKGVRLVTNEELVAQGIVPHPSIDTYPPEVDGDFYGCYVEWQAPYRDPRTGRIPRGLYRIWNDPYAHDKDNKEITLKNSMGAAYVYERPNNITPSRGDILIGAYIGRPPAMDDYNRQLLLLCEYCGGEDGILMFENDRGDVKPFFTKNKALNLLAEEPDMIHNKELQSRKTGRGKGMLINPVRKGTGAIYYRDWLYTVRGIDSEGNKRYNLHCVYDLGLLQESEKWNIKGNFDRVSCMIVGMFDMKEEYEKLVEPNMEGMTDDWFNRKHFA